MNKSGIFLISLLALSGFIVLASTAPVQAQEPEVIEISTAATGNLYEQDSIELQPDTTYIIRFTNVQEATGHNLVIDVNQNLEDEGESSLEESADLLIGLAGDAEQPAGGWPGTWEKEWKTPAEDTDVLFYCSFPAHWSGGMEGVFIIGEGAAPGFGFFFAFAALAMTAIAVPRLRRN